LALDLDLEFSQRPLLLKYMTATPSNGNFPVGRLGMEYTRYKFITASSMQRFRNCRFTSGTAATAVS
jgi:hypothetical protein